MHLETKEIVAKQQSLGLKNLSILFLSTFHLKAMMLGKLFAKRSKTKRTLYGGGATGGREGGGNGGGEGEKVNKALLVPLMCPNL